MIIKVRPKYVSSVEAEQFDGERLPDILSDNIRNQVFQVSLSKAEVILIAERGGGNEARVQKGDWIVRDYPNGHRRIKVIPDKAFRLQFEEVEKDD